MGRSSRGRTRRAARPNARARPADDRPRSLYNTSAGTSEAGHPAAVLTWSEGHDTRDSVSRTSTRARPLPASYDCEYQHTFRRRTAYRRTITKQRGMETLCDTMGEYTNSTATQTTHCNRTHSDVSAQHTITVGSTHATWARVPPADDPSQPSRRQHNKNHAPRYTASCRDGRTCSTERSALARRQARAARDGSPRGMSRGSPSRRRSSPEREGTHPPHSLCTPPPRTDRPRANRTHQTPSPRAPGSPEPRLVPPRSRQIDDSFLLITHYGVRSLVRRSMQLEAQGSERDRAGPWMLDAGSEETAAARSVFSADGEDVFWRRRGRESPGWVGSRTSGGQDAGVRSRELGVGWSARFAGADARSSLASESIAATARRGHGRLELGRRFHEERDGGAAHLLRKRRTLRARTDSGRRGQQERG